MVSTPGNVPCQNAMDLPHYYHIIILIFYPLPWIRCYTNWWKRSLVSKNGQHRKVFFFQFYMMFGNSDSIKNSERILSRNWNYCQILMKLKYTEKLRTLAGSWFANITKIANIYEKLMPQLSKYCNVQNITLGLKSYDIYDGLIKGIRGLTHKTLF